MVRPKYLIPVRVVHGIQISEVGDLGPTLKNINKGPSHDRNMMSLTALEITTSMPPNCSIVVLTALAQSAWLPAS